MGILPPSRPRFETREYQVRAISDLRAALRTNNSVILYAPTGSGKTAIACEITAKAAARGSSVLFLGDSTEIVEQTSATMDYWGVSHGIIQAGNTRRAPWEAVHVGTIQTLRNRTLPKKDLVFVDECHLARASSWHTVIEHYIQAGSKVIGLSATPCRLDGKGLGKLFQEIVYCPSIQDLTDAGYLVPFRIFAPPAPDTSKVRTQQGDFRKDDLISVCDQPKLIGDAVEHYAKMARGRLAILAATGIQHSQHLAEAFRAAGIPAAHADGTTPREERRRILKSLPAGEILVLCQVDICGKGWDCREVSCAIDCRPTQSLARWLQFVGRAIRTAADKQDSILLDHAGNVHRFGLPDEPREWTLEETSATKKKASEEAVVQIYTCRQCFAAFRRGPDKCPYCACPVPASQRHVPVADGHLEEIKRERKALAIDEWRQRVTGDERRAKFEEFRQIARERGYKASWPFVKFKVIFGHEVPSEWRSVPRETHGSAHGEAVNQ